MQRFRLWRTICFCILATGVGVFLNARVWYFCGVCFCARSAGTVCFEKRLFLPPDKAGIFRGAWLLAIFSVGFLLPQQAKEAGVSVFARFCLFCALARGGREVFGRCLFAFSFFASAWGRVVSMCFVDVFIPLAFPCMNRSSFFYFLCFATQKARHLFDEGSRRDCGCARGCP